MTATTASGRAAGFVAGFVLGLLVLPLTALFFSVFGTRELTPLVFVALTAGAIQLEPRSGARTAGVVAGILAEVAAGAAVVGWYLMTHDITIG